MQQWPEIRGSGDQSSQLDVFDTCLGVGHGFGSALSATSNTSLLTDSTVSLFDGGDLSRHLHDELHLPLERGSDLSSRLKQAQAPGGQTVPSAYSQISPSLLRGEFYGSSFKDSNSRLAPSGNGFQPLTPGPLSHPALDNHISSLQDTSYQNQSHWQDVNVHGAGHGLVSSNVTAPPSTLPTDFIQHTQCTLTEANPMLRPESLLYGPPAIKGKLSEATELMQITCNACQKAINSGLFQMFGDVCVHQQCCICSSCPERVAVNDSAYLQNGRIKCQLCARKPDQCLITSGNIQGHFMSPPMDANAMSGQTLPSLCADLGHDSSLSHLLPSAKDAEVFASRASSPDSPSSNTSDLSDSANGDLSQDAADGSKGSESSKARGPRTQIKPEQLTVLAETFDRNPKPSRHVQEKVAKETGLTKRVVQVWFQNKRSKEKRIRQMQRPQFSDLALYNLHVMAGNMLMPPHSGVPFFDRPGHVATNQQRREWQHASTGAIPPDGHQETGISPASSNTRQTRLVHPAATPGSAVVRPRPNRTPTSNWTQYKEEESRGQYPPVHHPPFTGNLHRM